MKLEMTIFWSLMLSLPSHHLLTFRILHESRGEGGRGGEMGLCLVSRQCLKVNVYTFITSRGHEARILWVSAGSFHSN